MSMIKEDEMITARQRYRVWELMCQEIGNHDNTGPDDVIGRYFSGNREWCAEFVSWIYFFAGVAFTGGSFTSSVAQLLGDRGDKGTWMQRSTTRIKDWFTEKGWYVDRSHQDWYQMIPQTGDWVFIGRSNSDRMHSGLVEYVCPSGTLHTIEGNNGGRPVARYQYPFYKWNTDLDGTANGIVRGIGVR